MVPSFRILVLLSADYFIYKQYLCQDKKHNSRYISKQKGVATNVAQRHCNHNSNIGF